MTFQCRPLGPLLYLSVALLGLALSACPKSGNIEEERTPQPETPSEAVCAQNADCASGEICGGGICIPFVTEAPSIDAGPNTVPLSTPDAGAAPQPVTDAGIQVVDAGPPAPITSYGIDITSPYHQSGHFANAALRFSAQASATGPDVDWSNATVTWTTETQANLYTGLDTGTFLSSFSTSLPSGHQVVSARLMRGTEVLATDSISLYMCEHGILLDFSEAPDEESWYSLVDRGNSSRNIWHSDGYVEMTNYLSQHAALFYLGRTIHPGDLRMNVRVSLGQCSTPGPCTSGSDGADGFAISIFDVSNEASLKSLIENHTSNGGTLGFMLVNDAENNPPPAVEAFHLEFDTYYNQLSWGHPHTDPTTQDHIQVHINGSMDDDIDVDPNSEVELWAEVPVLRDNEWHDIGVVIAGTEMTVTMDDEVIITGNVPSFDFKGGYLGVTSTTGGLFSYQRIDDFEIFDNCPYQDPEESP